MITPQFWTERLTTAAAEMASCRRRASDLGRADVLAVAE
jgi:hypothetical protein